MLIQFSDIVKKYGIPRGIIHIGAHLAEEREAYKKYNIDNILWIEANPYLIKEIQHYSSETEQILNYAISDIDDQNLKLYLTNNGQSSSLLKLNIHKKYYPNIYINKTLNVLTKRMDTIIKTHTIDMTKYNFLNLDIQGMELKAIEGFGSLINYFDFIYTEVNTNHLYENCCLINEIDAYLSSYHFIRKETNITPFEWGDALYMKESIR
jgi:FkbM family methyltransferase